MKQLLYIAVLIYDFALIAGATYLVGWQGWSMWTYLLAGIFYISISDSE